MFYSCVPDAVYPWDPKIMKRIREFAPDAVPMWVQWAFMTPQDTGNPVVEVFGRHALGRVIKGNREPLEGFRVLMPTMPAQGLHFERPNAIWFIHQGPQGLHPEYKDIPGDYLPFDHTIEEKAFDASRGFKMSEKEYKAYLYDLMVTKPTEARKRRQDAINDDMNYRQRDLEKYLRKVAEGISDVMMDEYHRAGGVRERESKPMVVVP